MAIVPGARGGAGEALLGGKTSPAALAPASLPFTSPLPCSGRCPVLLKGDAGARALRGEDVVIAGGGEVLGDRGQIVVGEQA